MERPRIGKDPERPKGWNSVIKGAQGNFDHLMRLVRRLAIGHNSLVDDVSDLRGYVNELREEVTDPTTGDVISSGVTDHGALTGLGDDDHTQYQKESEKGAALGYASLGADTLVPQDQLGTGVQDGTKFLRDDGTWQTVSVPASGVEVQEGDVQVAAAATVLDFDASDFNVTETPAGEANIALAYGTGAGTPAEGNHTHAGSGGGGTLMWSSKVSIVRGSQSRRIYVPSTWDPLAISFCYVSLPEANTGSCIVDVHKNGTTIYTTQANRPTVTAGFVSAEKVPDVTTVAPGDYFECIIDQVGAGTRGRVQVYIVLA
jgi:hypothetical protein